MQKSLMTVCIILHETGVDISELTKKTDKEKMRERAINDWMFAAMVIDRLCLICFTLFIVVSSFGITFN
jgi:nicotinic acetylcholine receptor